MDRDVLAEIAKREEEAYERGYDKARAKFEFVPQVSGAVMDPWIGPATRPGAEDVPRYKNMVGAPEEKPKKAQGIPDSRILTAIADCKAEIKSPAYDGKNTSGGGFWYVSINAFMEAVRVPMAKQGLVVQMDQVEEAIRAEQLFGKTQQMLWITFALQLFHKSGERLPAVRRAVPVFYNGPQAVGSAQSYALKQFYRVQFCVATGEDDDADRTQTPEGRPPVTAEMIAEAIGTMDGVAASVGTIEAVRDVYEGLTPELKDHPDVIAHGKALAKKLQGAKPAAKKAAEPESQESGKAPEDESQEAAKEPEDESQDPDDAPKKPAAKRKAPAKKAEGKTAPEDLPSQKVIDAALAQLEACEDRKQWDAVLAGMQDIVKKHPRRGPPHQDQRPAGGGACRGACGGGNEAGGAEGGRLRHTGGLLDGRRENAEPGGALPRSAGPRGDRPDERGGRRHAPARVAQGVHGQGRQGQGLPRGLGQRGPAVAAEGEGRQQARPQRRSHDQRREDAPGALAPHAGGQGALHEGSDHQAQRGLRGLREGQQVRPAPVLGQETG